MRYYTIVGMVLITALLIAVFVFTPYKYEKYTFNGNTIPIKINRITGDTYVYSVGSGEWIKLHNN